MHKLLYTIPEKEMKITHRKGLLKEDYLTVILIFFLCLSIKTYT